MDDGSKITSEKTYKLYKIVDNNKEEVIEEYYVNLNGGREYIINKYL